MILMVATGQGTIAMEIIKELPTVDYILVPIGGGGLATGVSTLAKMLNPKIKVIGVEPAGAACMKASLAEGHVVTLPTAKHHCRRYCGEDTGRARCFPYIQENLDEIITVEDEELIVAFLDMMENHKMVVENSGLLTVAALKHMNRKGQEGCIHLQRRQYGRHHYVLCGAARTDCQRDRDLHRICTAA